MVVGRIVAAHGLRGQLRVEPTTDFLGRFAKGETLLLDGREHRIETSALHKGRPLIKLSDIDTIESAQKLQWTWLEQPEGEAPPMDEGEFLVSDLLGLSVLLPDGRVLGTVDEVLTSAAHETLRVGETLIPFVEAFVSEVDFTTRTLRFRPIPGMLPGEEPTIA